MIVYPTSSRLPRLAAAFVFLTTVAARGAGDFVAEPSWQPVSVEVAFGRLVEYLDSAAIAPDRQAAVRAVWQAADSEAASSDLLERMATAFAQADERAAELVRFCSQAAKPGSLPEFAWLADSATPVLLRNNLRLYLARWQVQHGYFDEALAWMAGLKPADVVAPDALLFYRAVVHHQLVQPDEADASLAQLLQREEDLPARYQKLADLMRQDLAALQDESLDHIARRMEDVRRRLALGRSGQRVQGVENGIIESLDKMIEQAEQQMQQQQAQSSSAPGGQPSGTPMEQSQIAELKAPGSVDRRDIGRGADWGNLPDKEREKALQEIGREFPSHYREVIEEYFRRLAAEESADRP
jgi:hypothetical protein